MTASEAGHAEVVALLAADPRCNLNAQNTYGQTALSLSAQNNHRGAVAALIAAPAGAGREKLAIDLLCGKHTAAELARRAGHSALADILAEQSRQGQISLLMSALLDGGAASGLFDSLGARLTALRQAAGLAAPPLEADDDPGDVMGWKPVCTICMTQDADTALKPCFHACFCGSCADALLAGGAGVALCPICRVYVLETQHVFL